MRVHGSRHLAGALAAIVLAWSLGCSAAAADGNDQAVYVKLQAATADLERFRADAMPDYLEGRPEKVLAAMETAAKPHGWAGLLAIANMTWTMHPQQSLAWHEQAAKASHDHPLTMIELGLHYTRREECDRALAVWDKLERKGMMGGYFPALKAYCLLRLGHDAEAVTAVRGAEFGSHGGMRYAEVLGELWGERPAVARFADVFAAYRRSAPEASLDAVVRAAANLPDEDAERYDALVHVTAFAATRESADAPLMRDLVCLRPLFEQQAEENRAEIERGAARERAYEKALADNDYEAAGRFLETSDNRDAGAASSKKQWNDTLARCDLMTEKRPLPASGALLHLLTIEHQQRELATGEDLLARHGAALWARASSEQGDVEALEVLAALQSAAGDREGLRRSDELGWHRYRLPKFAASRVYGALLDAKPGDAELQRLLGEALRDFPDDSLLLDAALQSGHFDAMERKGALRRLLLAQHHAPSPMSDLHTAPTASQLIGTWVAYAQAIGDAPH